MESIIIEACDSNDTHTLREVLLGQHPDHYQEVTVNNLNKGLVKASEHGFLECAELLLNAGADLDYTNEDGDTPLTRATRNGHIELVKYFLTKPVDINKINDEILRNSLRYSTIDDNTEIVDMFLAVGTKILLSGPCCKTLLYHAISRSNVDLVKVYLEKCCSDSKEILSDGCLVGDSVMSRNNEITRLLIETGAGVNIAETVADYPPLHYAVMYSKPETVDLLLNAGADINAKGLVGETALILACMSGSIESFECLDIILRNKHLNCINAVDHSGCTALGNAVNKNSLPFVRKLIKEGALVEWNCVDLHEHSQFFNVDPMLITTCLKKGNFEMANVLVASGQYTFQAIQDQLYHLSADEVTDEVRAWTCDIFKPWPLLSLCRVFINNALRKHVEQGRQKTSQMSLSDEKQKIQNIQALPLTNCMKMYLMFSDL